MTEVEFAGKTRGQLLKARGVSHGCPASGFLFTPAFDPIFRWLHDSTSSRNPADPHFFQLRVPMLMTLLLLLRPSGR